MVPIRETRKKKYVLSTEKKRAFHNMLLNLCTSLAHVCGEVHMKIFEENEKVFAQEIYQKKPGLFRTQRLLLAFYRWDSVLLKIWDESIQDLVREAVVPYSNIPDLGLEEITLEHTYTYRKGYAPKQIGALSFSETGGELSEAPQSGILTLSETGKK